MSARVRLPRPRRLCEKPDCAVLAWRRARIGMIYIVGHGRSQLLPLPEAVDDYLGSDNSVRFIDAFVDGLDLAAAGCGRAAQRVTGCRA